MQQGQGGPVQGVSGVSACLQELNSQSESGIQLMDHTNQSQVQGHSQSHQHVDDFLEQILNIPPWSEVGASVKAPWDYNNSNNNNNGSMSLAAENMNIDINPRLFTISLMPAGLGNERHGTSGYSSSAENLHFSSSAFENSILDSRQNESLIGGGASESPASMVLQLGSSPRLAVGAAKTRSPSSGGSSASDGSCSAASSIQSPTQAHAWRLPFAGGGGGVRNPLPLSLGQAMGEEARLLGERLRDEEAIRPLNRVMLPSFGSGLGIRPNNQQSFLAQNLGATIQPQLQTPAGLVPTPTAITATAPTPARPRARARRGQATDPHSIAERQRRERIAERMKALQELVPSCNKTDRAAMLDDILDYVKFLQFQVKVLSMSRIGGAAAVAPLITEMSSEGQGASSSRNNDSQISSSEESLAMTERQVARLMEEDMGAAMQYLQSKGLCVMPLSLATAMAGSQPSILPTAATNRISALPQADRDHESITEALPRGATATDNANGFNTVVKSEGQSLRGGPPK